VVLWTTVRLLLILTVVFQLHSKQVDYTLAFLHAPLDDGEVVFVRMPRRFDRPGYVMKLKKSVYGL
jgi:hypothetical protein